MNEAFGEWTHKGRWVVGCLALGPWTVWAQVSPAMGDVDWKQANEAVAEFPRGHADVLKWEKLNLPAPRQSEQVVGVALNLMSPEAAVRQAWSAHRGLQTVMQRLGTVNVDLIAQGRGAEVDASLQRRVADMAELLELASQGRKAWVQAVAAR